jgi:hypothetical protein
MAIAELTVFVLVFGAVVGAYILGHRETPFAKWQRSLRELRRYQPPIDVVIEYQNKAGFRSQRRLAILRSLCGKDGQVYVLGICRNSNKPRTFRTDRISCFATTDGEVLDKQRFLLERLALPTEVCRL